MPQTLQILVSVPESESRQLGRLRLRLRLRARYHGSGRLRLRLRNPGRKFEGSEGFPDLKIGWTMECFQGSGTSDRVKQELMMWRMTSPIAGKLAFNMRMHTPSAPQAAEFRMPKTVCPSISRVTGERANEQAPHKGKTGISGSHRSPRRELPRHNLAQSWPFMPRLKHVFKIIFGSTITPSPRHRLGYWRTIECLGGGGITPPMPSHEPLVEESRARRHSKALHKTRQNHLSELKIEVKCEVKVRSKVKIWRFDVLGPGARIIESDGSNSGKMLSKAWLRYCMSISGILRKLQGQDQVTKGHYM